MHEFNEAAYSGSYSKLPLSHSRSHTPCFLPHSGCVGYTCGTDRGRSRIVPLTQHRPSEFWYVDRKICEHMQGTYESKKSVIFAYTGKEVHSAAR